AASLLAGKNPDGSAQSYYKKLYAQPEQDGRVEFDLPGSISYFSYEYDHPAGRTTAITNNGIYGGGSHIKSTDQGEEIELTGTVYVPAQSGTIGTVAGMSVRLRAGASLSSQVYGYYNTGAQFTVLGTSGEWVNVKTSSGLVGYMHSAYIKIGTAGSTPTTGGVADQIVATSKLYLGTPYVWAGMSPSGFDCSGFVYYLYKNYGYSLHRVAQDMYSYDGVYVDKANLRPGDLVCFGYGPYSITHVGMYIGNGQFIHSSSGTGYVVITDLSSSYYTRMYVGAKRIIN
ncbi:MAG: C40 family peptidase, partial [Oscillospiraceae bacterium]|nr:C40 family peptidase [Oscillospiraceae bacterium]